MTFDANHPEAQPLELQLKHSLCELLVRHGAETGTQLEQRVALAIAQLAAALGETSSDGESLSALDVMRIRFGKLAAFVLPPAVFRDPEQLARLRTELLELARRFVSEEEAAKSRFAAPR